MKRWRQNEAHKTAGQTRMRRPLASHPLFAMVLGLWGAALGGLVTLVLPRELVLVAAANAGLAQLGAKAPFVLAAIMALVTGGAMFAIASAIAQATGKARARGSTPSLAAVAVRHVQTIDPASELGSASLDDPVETMPFSGRRPDTDNEASVKAEPAAPAAPLALDLAEFAALPGRNAVWVEEPAAPVAASEPVAEAEMAPLPATGSAPEPVAGPVAVPAAPRPVSPSAIERLRAVPTSELSLVQMVERFAAALHEHQSAPPGRADQAGRDAALAEALKALAAFSQNDDTVPQSEPLRAALSRLQELRGAA
jgi:hypothetical protein